MIPRQTITACIKLTGMKIENINHRTEELYRGIFTKSQQRNNPLPRLTHPNRESQALILTFICLMIRVFIHNTPRSRGERV